MLNEAEWKEIKKDLIDLYDKRNILSSYDIEKNLNMLLVRNSETKNLSEKIKATGSKFLLSDREIEVLVELLDGRTNCEISENLSVSISTVKKHVYNIFNKTGVSSRTQLLNLVYTMQMG